MLSAMDRRQKGSTLVAGLKSSLIVILCFWTVQYDHVFQRVYALQHYY